MMKYYLMEIEKRDVKQRIMWQFIIKNLKIIRIWLKKIHCVFGISLYRFPIHFSKRNTSPSYDKTNGLTICTLSSLLIDVQRCVFIIRKHWWQQQSKPSVIGLTWQIGHDGRRAFIMREYITKINLPLYWERSIPINSWNYMRTIL